MQLLQPGTCSGVVLLHFRPREAAFHQRALSVTNLLVRVSVRQRQLHRLAHLLLLDVCPANTTLTRGAWCLLDAAGIVRQQRAAYRPGRRTVELCCSVRSLVENNRPHYRENALHWSFDLRTLASRADPNPPKARCTPLWLGLRLPFVSKRHPALRVGLS
jgi:hypothetical protein